MPSVEKYSWNFDETEERWGNDTHNAIVVCIAEARQALDEKNYQTDEPPTRVYIGENKPFIPSGDADSVLEALEEQANEFAGEVGGDWDAFNCKKREELEELSKLLSEVVITWLDKYGYTPDFYRIENVEAYEL